MQFKPKDKGLWVTAQIFKLISGTSSFALFILLFMTREAQTCCSDQTYPLVTFNALGFIFKYENQLQVPAAASHHGNTYVHTFTETIQLC